MFCFFFGSGVCWVGLDEGLLGWMDDGMGLGRGWGGSGGGAGQCCYGVFFCLFVCRMRVQGTCCGFFVLGISMRLVCTLYLQL